VERNREAGQNPPRVVAPSEDEEEEEEEEEEGGGGEGEEEEEEEFDVCTTGDTIYVDTIFKILSNTRRHGCIDILHCCSDPCL
jgi:hypothetical protein